MAVLKIFNGAAFEAFPGSGGLTAGATVVTAAAVLTAGVIPVGDDGVRGVKDNTGAVELVSTTLRKLTQFTDSNGKTNLFFVPLWVSGDANFFVLSNASEGSAPRLTASNVIGDANVNAEYHTKGTGSHEFLGDLNVTGDLGVTGTVKLDASTSAQIIDENDNPLHIFRHSGAGDANHLTEFNTAAGGSPGFDTDGTDTDIDFLVIPKGAGSSIFAGTRSLRAPTGTGFERPISPVNGDMRYNSTTSKFEIRENGVWINPGNGGGASGEFHSVLYAEAEEFAINTF